MTRIPQAKPLEDRSGSQEAETSSRPLENLKVALVCDWLTVVGGAEQVLREIHHLFPSAPIYTSQYRPKGIDWFKDAEVKTGWLNLLPAFLRRFIAPLRQSYFNISILLNMISSSLFLAATQNTSRPGQVLIFAIVTCLLNITGEKQKNIKRIQVLARLTFLSALSSSYFYQD